MSTTDDKTGDKIKERAAAMAAKAPKAVEEPLRVGPHGAYAYILTLKNPCTWLGLAAVLVGCNRWLPASARAHAFTTAAVGGIVMLMTIAWCMVKCYYTRHILEEGKLVLERGVFWRSSYPIPFNLVYNCTCTQNPLQVRFGSGTLHVMMADMKTMDVPWLIHPVETRDILLSERPRVVMWGQQ